MRTKFLFPDWDDNDECEEPQSLCDQMREMENERQWREQMGLPEKKEPEKPSPTAKSPRKRANFFSDLVDQIAKAKVLLFAEDGEPFAYDEELGCYRPIPQLTAWLANFFPEITTRSLLANDLREIAQRLTWREDLRCSRDDFNRSKELVNLENGVFNLETGELLEHDPRFQFTYQVNASYRQDPECINCPAFEEFCRSSLNGDPKKRQLLLEIGRASLPSSLASYLIHHWCPTYRFISWETVFPGLNWRGKRSISPVRSLGGPYGTSPFSSPSPAATESRANSKEKTSSISSHGANCYSRATRCRERQRRTLQPPLRIGSWFCSSTRASRRSSRTSVC